VGIVIEFGSIVDGFFDERLKERQLRVNSDFMTSFESFAERG